jgi:hypothetical protein
MAHTWLRSPSADGFVVHWLGTRAQIQRNRILCDGHVWVFGVIGAREARRV